MKLFKIVYNIIYVKTINSKGRPFYIKTINSKGMPGGERVLSRRVLVEYGICRMMMTNVQMKYRIECYTIIHRKNDDQTIDGCKTYKMMLNQLTIVFSNLSVDFNLPAVFSNWSQVQ